MRMIRRCVCLAIFLAVAARPVHSQAPGGFGTSSGLLGAAVTESRRFDAVGANPALLGVYEEGPVRTTSVLSLDAAVLPGHNAFDAAARLGQLSGRVDDRRFRFVRAPMLWQGSSSFVSAAQVRWAAIQSREFAITLDTRFSSGGVVPDSLAALLGLERSGEAWEGAISSRVMSSVLTVGQGKYVGEVPVFGRLWAGVAAKGWWVHEFARGGFIADAPTVRVYGETAVRGAAGAGVDGGLAGLASGRVWYGISVSNLVQASFDPRSAARQRFVDVTAAGGELEVTQEVGPGIRADDPDTAAVRAAEELWNRLRYPSMLRVGVSVRSTWGTWAVATNETLKRGGLDAAAAEPRRSVAWHDGPRRFAVAYGWGGGHAVATAAVSGGRCDRRWTAGVRRTAGLGYGLSFDLSLSDWSCNLHAGSR
jgi:hypothetical protein